MMALRKHRMTKMYKLSPGKIWQSD